MGIIRKQPVYIRLPLPSLRTSIYLSIYRKAHEPCYWRKRTKSDLYQLPTGTTKLIQSSSLILFSANFNSIFSSPNSYLYFLQPFNQLWEALRQLIGIWPIWIRPAYFWPYQIDLRYFYFEATFRMTQLRGMSAFLSVWTWPLSAVLSQTTNTIAATYHHCFWWGQPSPALCCSPTVWSWRNSWKLPVYIQ